MIAIHELLRTLRQVSGQTDLEARALPRQEWQIDLGADALRAAVEAMAARHGVRHLSAITAEIDGDRVLVHYHFWEGAGITLTVACALASLEVPSITDLVPAAEWYEREAAEMLGLTFSGHPNPQPLFLPDDWDSGPPLRPTEGSP